METTQPLVSTRTTRIALGRLAYAAAGTSLLLFALGFLWLRQSAPSDGSAGAYVTSSWTDAGMAITALPGASGPLRDGDRVIAVNGRSLADWLA
ncbi:MAG TPA: hypothetical protein VF013_03690, partial [Candidatus Limnocylindria bacterium]